MDTQEKALLEQMRDLQKALEVGMYYGYPLHEHGLRGLLGKLDIKSANAQNNLGALFNGMAVQMESIEASMKQVTFSMDKLRAWAPSK